MNTTLLLPLGLLFLSLMLGWVLDSVLHPPSQHRKQVHELKHRQLSISMEQARTSAQLDRDLLMMGRGYLSALDCLEQGVGEAEAIDKELLLSVIALMRSSLPDIIEQTRKDAGVSDKESV